MKYDDTGWHTGGKFPADLPPEAAGTHAGVFLAWALLRGLGGAMHVDIFPQEVTRLRTRSVTPGQFFLESCDGKLIDENLSDEGNAFAADYYGAGKGRFFVDYALSLPDELPSLYHADDSWATFELVAPMLDSRLSGWRAGRRPLQ